MEIAPVTAYDPDLLLMLQEEFNDEKKSMFAGTFHRFLAFDADNDFVINLEDVVPWLGFARKAVVKRLVVSHLTLGVHYIISGRNKEAIFLTVVGFKSLCMAVNTDTAKRVREYYINMERVLFKHIARVTEACAA